VFIYIKNNKLNRFINRTFYSGAMRLDRFLVEKNFTTSRSKAMHLIKTGNVFVNGQIILKQSYDVDGNCIIELKNEFRYASRGGFKIEGLVDHLKIPIKDKSILDIGCSVGGFSDFFLQREAIKVIAIDVSNLLDPKLLSDPRLRFIKMDIRETGVLRKELVDEKFDIITIDISNISLKDVLLRTSEYLGQEGCIIALFKPDYEGGKGSISKEKIEHLCYEFEKWLSGKFDISHKEFSDLRGGAKSTGINEVFYILTPIVVEDL
jgi:23S rRNA (cytidine1920-2'-O)/16S rRNA (cytidine1409-2'-O)-methyltransferase